MEITVTIKCACGNESEYTLKKCDILSNLTETVFDLEDISDDKFEAKAYSSESHYLNCLACDNEVVII